MYYYAFQCAHWSIWKSKNSSVSWVWAARQWYWKWNYLPMTRLSLRRRLVGPSVGMSFILIHIISLKKLRLSQIRHVQYKAVNFWFKPIISLSFFQNPYVHTKPFSLTFSFAVTFKPCENHTPILPPTTIPPSLPPYDPSPFHIIRLSQLLNPDTRVLGLTYLTIYLFIYLSI